MTQQDNGGAAFPSLHAIGDIAYSKGGMSLRDWFAGQIAAGLYSGMGANLRCDDASIKADAEIFYRLADAMLAARISNAD